MNDHLFSRFSRHAGAVAATILSLFLATTGLQAETLSTSIDSSFFGYLDQYSLNSEHNFVGDEACVPTSSTNAMTLLQNLYPAIYGTSLTGTTYADWHDTDHTLIGLYGTTASEGTYDSQFVNALHTYMVDTKGFTDAYFSGYFPADDGWTLQYPKPDFITDGKPSAHFIYESLSSLNGVLIGIDYADADGNLTGGGHELLASGILWDTETNTGTINFIDPLDPATSYIQGADADPATSYPQSSGSALVTVGTITLTSSGHLLLNYNQYDVDGVKVPTPTEEDYQQVYARIDSALAFGAIPEPSTYALLCGGAVMLIVARRLRKAPTEV